MRLREMTASELRKMNNNNIIDYLKSAMIRMREGVAPSEIIQMKRKIILAMILKEKFPSYTEAADKIINTFSGVEKLKLT